MDTKNNEMENRDSGNSPDEKYIHVKDIPSKKLDNDEDYGKSKGGKMPEKETDLERKTKEDQAQGDETLGIP